MNFKNLNFSRLLVCLFIGMAYPILSYVSSDGDKLLRLINGMTICSLVLLVFGAFNILVLHGDMDITSFVAARFLSKGKSKGWDAYKKDREDDRKQRFNYPLFTGLLMLGASILLTVIYY